MTPKETLEKHLDNIICVETGFEDSQCPITDIKFVGSGGVNDAAASDRDDAAGSDSDDGNTGKTWREYRSLDLNGYDVDGGFSIEKY